MNTQATYKTKILTMTKTIVRTLSIVAVLLILIATPVYAGGLDLNTGVAQFDALIGFLAAWVGRLGGVVAFIGGVRIAIGMVTDNPSAKVSGMWFMVGGFMVVALALAHEFFINIS